MEAIKREWKKYKRKGLSEMVEYLPGMDMEGISIAGVDKQRRTTRLSIEGS
jgi:hypothetical protein